MIENQIEMANTAPMKASDIQISRQVQSRLRVEAR
jgi:hypothetical protein